MDPTSVTPTPHQLRALAHPVRVRLLGQLRAEGPATATSLAHRLGLNSGATSYHLRQLAQHGFVVDDESRGNGRERWWRAAHQSTRAVDSDSPETEPELDAFLQAVATVYSETLHQALEERPRLDPAWRQASDVSDWGVRLTPARAQRLIAALHAVMAEVDDEPDEDARAFVVQISAFLRPGQLPAPEDDR